ncbi:MAG: hypothetical protein V4717_06220 [Bacteroidota bacterium]
MRYLLLLIVVALLAFKQVGIKEKPVERLGVPGPLIFGNTNFKLAWTNKTESGNYTQKYLPAGDSLINYRQMLTLELFKDDTLLERVVQNKIRELEARKKVDEYCNYNVIKSPDGDEFMLDFLTGEMKDKSNKLLQFNIWHYKLINIEGQGKFIELYAYTKRSYDNEIKTFLKHFRNDRIDMLAKMVSAGMPAIVINR